MWETCLREEKGIRDIFCRKTAGYKISKVMMVRGKNKYESESNWV